MRNLIDAIDTIVRGGNHLVGDETTSTNRLNSDGEALEDYIKDVFADSLGVTPQERLLKRSAEFSYLGNQSNPPDAMIRGGEAIEIKKLESVSPDLALNSSYPKDKLYSTSTSISAACRNCEEWESKDMIYAVGVVNSRDKSLKSLCFVYGEDYCADKSVYEGLRTRLKEGIKQIEGIDFAETQELGRINKVDPLGITYLRCRNMWHIKNPMALFRDFYSFGDNASFTLVAIINDERLRLLGNEAVLRELEKDFPNFEIKDISIPDPNNPANIKSAKIITYYESN